MFRNLYDDYVASSGRVKIGNNIYFGRDVTVLKGVEIGDNCIIGIGSLVTKDIPANSVACGTPCRVVCGIEEYYKKRKQLQYEEALYYGKSIEARYNRPPVITDFTEEWILFFRETDFDKYPEMHSIIDKRLGKSYDTFFKHQEDNIQFNGFDDFLAHI